MNDCQKVFILNVSVCFTWKCIFHWVFVDKILFTGLLTILFRTASDIFCCPCVLITCRLFTKRLSKGIHPQCFSMFYMKMYFSRNFCGQNSICRATVKWHLLLSVCADNMHICCTFTKRDLHIKFKILSYLLYRYFDFK